MDRIILSELSHKFKDFPETYKYWRETSKVALIIEPRYSQLMKQVINNFAYYMNPEGWNFIICSHKNHREQIEKDFPKLQFFAIPDEFTIPGEANMTISMYNDFLMSKKLWSFLKTCGYYICAIYQTDCFMFKMFDKEYEKYDFSGANWYGPDSLTFGENIGSGINGGFSIRNIGAMITCLNSVNWTMIETKRKEDLKNNYFALPKRNEDVFFSYALELIKPKLAPCPTELRGKLAIECEDTQDTCVIHGWNHNRYTPKFILDILKQTKYVQ